MELIILDSAFNSITIIDTFESLLWVDRYCGFGDFEIYIGLTEEIRQQLTADSYLYLHESPHQMIIESSEIVTDAEAGDKLIITGRSLESILLRRIIWGQTIIEGSLQDGIASLLNANVISPTDTDRTISNFIFTPSTDPIILALTVSAQFFGDNLYFAIKDLCAANNIGFKVFINDSNNIEFTLYAGADRSYDQFVNPYVIFSPKFDNIISMNYVESNMDLKTITLVGGEGEGSNIKTTSVSAPAGSLTGINRRELFTDASSVSQTTDGGTLTDPEYLAQLAQKGIEDLVKNDRTNNFEGVVDAKVMFKYREDFFIGDIVQIATSHNISSKSRVTEIIHSESTEGIDIYPTFTKIE